MQSRAYQGSLEQPRQALGQMGSLPKRTLSALSTARESGATIEVNGMGSWASGNGRAAARHGTRGEPRHGHTWQPRLKHSAQLLPSRCRHTSTAMPSPTGPLQPDGNTKGSSHRLPVPVSTSPTWRLHLLLLSAAAIHGVVPGAAVPLGAFGRGGGGHGRTCRLLLGPALRCKLLLQLHTSCHRYMPQRSCRILLLAPHQLHAAVLQYRGRGRGAGQQGEGSRAAR